MSKLKLEAKPGSTKQIKTGSWKTYLPVTDHKRCIGCGTCELYCPEGIIHPIKKKSKTGKPIYDSDLNYCKGCGLCAEVCPVKCITMKLEER